MMNIKRFFEWNDSIFDYERILRILKNTYGWGDGILTSIDEFESNQEYFLNPQDDDQYIEQFHIYLTDKKLNRFRNMFNNNLNLRLGEWKTGFQVKNPTSIYNKLY